MRVCSFGARQWRGLKRGLAVAGLAAGLVATAPPAQAQARYTCRLSNGTLILSDRPCASTGGTTGANTGMVYYGPTEQQNTTPSYVPKAAEAPDHLKYMSPRCASMSDALRTASVRGLKYEATAELRKNYHKECGDDEREALAQYHAERSGQFKAKQEEKRAGAARQQQSQLQQQQCDDSKRLLYSKRKRTDLTEGEKAELQRFEDNYRARCG